MQDKVIIKAPAKLNLFLRILGKQNNGYHIIRTGITFLNLHNTVSIRLSDINKVYDPPSLPERSSADYITELNKLEAELKTFEDKLIEIDDRDRLVLLRFNRELKKLLTDRGVVHAAVYDYI